MCWTGWEGVGDRRKIEPRIYASSNLNGLVSRRERFDTTSVELGIAQETKENIQCYHATALVVFRDGDQ